MVRFYFICTVVLMSLLGVVFYAHLPVSNAQNSSITIVGTYSIDAEFIENGDVISFDQNTGEYFLSNTPKDKQLFGVVDLDPIAVYRTNTQDGTFPVVQLGEVLVNVTNTAGRIARGDYVTTSPIPGKAQRFDGTYGYVIGVALQDFDPSDEDSVIFNEGDISFGQILVLLEIGQYSRAPVQEQANAPPVIINNTDDEIQVGLTIGTMFRYILATLFAAASLYLVFSHFGPNLREGVISVGRNPLAKSTIQSMVTFNMLLILVISIAAILVSLAIILLPV